MCKRRLLCNVPISLKFHAKHRNVYIRCKRTPAFTGGEYLILSKEEAAMRKKSNALLALLLTGAMTVTSVSPAFAAEEFSAVAEVQDVQDVAEEEPASDVSDVQDAEDFGSVADVEDVDDVFTSGEETSDPDTGDEVLELADGDAEEYVQDDLLLADNSEEKY